MSSATPAERHRASWLASSFGTFEVLGSAIVVSSFVVAALGHDPFRVVAAIAQGAFGSGAALEATLAEAVPLVLAGLAVGLPLRLGLFNVGAEGQLVLGGLAAGLAAAAFGGDGAAPAPLVVIPCAVLAAVAAGAIWGAIPGWLRARLGLHEVLSTILLNLIAFPLAGLVIRQAWAMAPGQIRQTDEAAATLPALYPALVVAVSLAVAYDVWLARTRGGLAARAIGAGARAAEVAGVAVGRGYFLALTAAGAFAGLVGAQQVLDTHGRYIEGFSPGFGFTAIAVALLGRGTGGGIVFAAIALGALRSGAFAMDALQVAPREVASIVQGVVILTAAALAARRTGGAA